MRYIWALLFKDCMKGEQKQKKEQELGKELYVLLESNLFLMMTPLKDEKEIGDIEDLFSDEVLNVEIEGKKECVRKSL